MTTAEKSSEEIHSNEGHTTDKTHTASHCKQNVILVL